MRTAFPLSRLEDLAQSIDYGVTASASGAKVGPQFLRITDIQDDRVDWSTVPFCATSEAEEKGARLEKGDIVFVRTGATTGKSFLIRECPKRSVFASYLIRVRPNLSEIEPRYLAWYFQTPDYWRQITSSVSGTAQPGVNATKLKALSVPRPPISDQCRIADILDKADAIRRKRRETIALTEQLLRSTFLGMFGDPVANPKGWPVYSLDELCDTKQYGTAEKANESKYGLPILRMGNLTYAGEIDLTDLKWVPLSEREGVKLDLRDGDVLFNRVNSHELVGKTAVWHHGDGYTFAGYLIRLRLKPEALGDYVSTAMNIPSVKRFLMNMAKPSINMANISGSDLARLNLPLPPLADQQKFKRVRRRMLSWREALNKHAEESAALFNSLIARAFSGDRSL